MVVTIVMHCGDLLRAGGKPKQSDEIIGLKPAKQHLSKAL
jgi:hypothetical protein